MESLDAALKRVGGYRRWHIWMVISLGISINMGFCMQQLSAIFTGKQATHTAVAALSLTLRVHADNLRIDLLIQHKYTRLHMHLNPLTCQ